MFEGWLSDLLASYLGHFLDVKKEKLRVSLWSGVNGALRCIESCACHMQASLRRLLAAQKVLVRARVCAPAVPADADAVLVHAPAWSTGFVLENVRLKVEAFEYLQLPFDITEGCIGRVEVQARHSHSTDSGVQALSLATDCTVWSARLA
jgi:hypothetical protein